LKSKGDDNLEGGGGGSTSAVAAANGSEVKAAKSVLKWGGGHAAEKKKERSLKRKECNFGDACNRTDCWFSHPRDGARSDAKGGSASEASSKKTKF
jgi:hypothetical protein